MRKELVILSGFLGSGKTTLLRHLLTQCRTRKVAVLLNDFGEIPVDGELLRRDGLAGGMVVEIGGGSVFCACLHESFVKALRDLRRRDEDLVIVEASGMSDPATVDKMLRLSGLDDDFEHTATICLFDPVKSLKLAHVLEVIPRQLASATVAVLTKSDLATEQELAAARAYISAREPDLPVVAASRGRLDPATLPARAARAFSFGFNTPETRPDTFSLTDVNCSADDLIAALEKEEHVLRVKGFVRACDGIWFLSDTGRGIEKRPDTAAPVPLTIICFQGSAESVRNTLQAGHIITLPA